MADHIRTQLRDAVVTALSGLTTTASRCKGGRPRSRPVQKNEMPCLVVYTNDVDAELSSGMMGRRRLEELCQLVVHGFARDTGDLDKKLDTIEKEVREALAANPTLGGLAKDLYYTGTRKDDADEGDGPTGEIQITFTLEYQTREDDVDAALA